MAAPPPPPLRMVSPAPNARFGAKVGAQLGVLTCARYFESCLRNRILITYLRASAMTATNNAFDETHDWTDSDVYATHPFRLAPPEVTPSHMGEPIKSKLATPFDKPVEASKTVPGVAIDPDAPMPHKRHLMNFPGFIARGAMFRVSRSAQVGDGTTILKVAGGTMTITGPMLCMRDKAVWEAAIQLAKERAPRVGDAFEIELRDFVRKMGSDNFSGKALAAVWSSLERLAKAKIQFEVDKGRCKGVGSLLASAFKSGGKMHLRLNPDFAIPALLCDKQFCFNIKRRNKLSSSLAKWLHDYYTTHSTTQDIDLNYLRGLCGYDGLASHFPAKLRQALDELLTAAPKLFASYSIAKTGRSADLWKLQVVLGEEKPSFLPSKSLPASSANKRRRGVAL